MKGVSPEQDQLMWSLAEEGNARAIDEFGERYPELRSELGRRLAMVAGLRGAQPGRKEAKVGIPVFRPRELRPNPPNPRLQFVIGAIVFAAVAAACYTTYQFAVPPAPLQVSIVRPNLAPPVLPSLEQPKEAVPAPDPNPDLKPPVPKDPDAVLPPDPTPAYLKLKDLKLSDVNLSDALRMVATGAGLKIDIAPLFEDRKVTVEFHSTSTIDILKALGKQYKFTPFDQGNGTVLIVPAVDTGAKIGDDIKNPESDEKRKAGV